MIHSIKFTEDFVERIPKLFILLRSHKRHPQLNFFIEQGNQIKRGAEVLGEITKDTVVFAITRTHGKTTTASFLTHYFAYLN